MQLQIQAVKLQEMVGKAVKGASSNKMIPITSMMAVSLTKGQLELITTDGSNILKIVEKKVSGDDFYVVVPVEIFSKLVAKITTEKVKLELKETSLQVVGNGTYQIELPLDEEGHLVKFPDYKFNVKTPKTSINLSSVKPLLATNKASLADTMDSPCLTGYYFNDKIVTTNTFKVCSNQMQVFGEPTLLSAEMVELFGVIEDEKVKVQRDGDKLLFTACNALIYGNILEGVEDYPIEAIEAYLQTEFISHCKLSKSDLLSVLDRLILFVSPYDRNEISMTFTPEGVIFSSKKNNGVELISYIDNKEFVPYNCLINIELFRAQILVQDTDVVQLWYGHEKAIKMINNKTTQIVALLEDDMAE